MTTCIRSKWTAVGTALVGISTGGGSSTVGIVNVDETCTFDTGKITILMVRITVGKLNSSLMESANGDPIHKGRELSDIVRKVVGSDH